MRYIEYFLLKFERLIVHKNPIHVLIFGYLTYVILGLLFILLPFAHLNKVPSIDHFFTVVSAVSTTGLVSISPSDNYSLFGQIVILILIQVGGIGYMTFGSFIILQTGHRFSKAREKLTRTAFPLPKSLDVVSFLRGVIFFTFAVELIGAIILAGVFYSNGESNFVWLGVFHSISAFCTAGFSLFNDNFLSYRFDSVFILTITLLSILGSIGYIVFLDFYLNFTKKRSEFTFTSKVILKITSLFILVCAALIFFFEPSISRFSMSEKLMLSFFQAVSSVTTVGFSTVSFSSLSPYLITVFYFFMLFGASPSGTGGGLKSTTFSALYGLVKSTLRRSSVVCFMNRRIPNKRLQLASSSFVFCVLLVWLSLILLSFTENIEVDLLLFEVISAIGTVGLSLDVTNRLSDLGKLIIIILMMIGRIGVLTFGLAIATTGNEEYVEGDNDLVI